MRRENAENGSGTTGTVVILRVVECALILIGMTADSAAQYSDPYAAYPQVTTTSATRNSTYQGYQAGTTAVATDGNGYYYYVPQTQLAQAGTVTTSPTYATGTPMTTTTPVTT
ncbi:MAG: hypothetical protein Q4C47_09190, partial [Planctomycetia bacterium]|nr:hypothetical protein [Planctomycetia bacterium]